MPAGGPPGRENERTAACLAILPKLGPGTPPLVRGWLLRQLQWIGKAEVVAALAPMLEDKDLMVRDCARRALEANPSPEAGAALRAAFEKADTEESLIGIVNSLAARRDAAAVPVIAVATKDKRAAVALAAVEGLGRIGTADAAAALAKVQPGSDASLLMRLQDAEIRCAERLLADGKKDAAGFIYLGLYSFPDNPTAVRVAALRGVLASGWPAAATLTGILTSTDAKLQPFVVPMLMEIQGPDSAKTVAAILPSVPPAAQVSLIEVLRERADPATRPAIMAAMKSPDEAVRAAATKALAAIGAANDVPALLQAAASSDATQRDAARYSLDHLPESVNATLIAAVAGADAKTRPELIRTLAARRAVAAMPAFIKAAADADAATRLAAIGGIEALGDEKAIGVLLAIMDKPPTDADRDAAEKALLAVSGRATNKEAAAKSLAVALRGSPVAPMAPGNALRLSCLAALTRVGNAEALATVRGTLKDSDAAVQEAAVRAMTEWPDAAAADDLLAIAQNDPKETNQVLAIRGLVRVAGLADVPAAKKVEVLTKTLAAAKRAEDKKLVLGAAGGVKSIEALRLVAPLLADNDLKEEAATAATRIAKALPSPLPAEVRPVLEKVVQVTGNDQTRRDAQGLLGKMPTK